MQKYTPENTNKVFPVWGDLDADPQLTPIMPGGCTNCTKRVSWWLFWGLALTNPPSWAGGQGSYSHQPQKQARTKCHLLICKPKRTTDATVDRTMAAAAENPFMMLSVYLTTMEV